VAASGFYEWRLENDRKQPYCCHIDHRLFSMAGIWEHWQDAEGNEIQSCAVLTTEARGAMQELHQRMPVYIAPQDYADWLDCRADNTEAADRLLAETAPAYEYYAVNSTVSNSRNEGPDLIKPLE
jgi:putative SOS response-associated peptidase YedK